MLNLEVKIMTLLKRITLAGCELIMRYYAEIRNKTCNIFSEF